MPEAAVDEAIAPVIDLPETTAGSAARESSNVFWLLSMAGLALIIPAWLLPWFVEPSANGVGFSPQDVVSSAPTGVGAVLIYVVGIAMLALLGGFLWDASCVTMGRRQPFEDPARRAAGGGAAIVVGILVSALSGGVSLVTFGVICVGVVLLLSLLHDAGCVVFRGRTAFHFMRVRGALALVGTLATLLVWVLIGIYREEDLFGTLSKAALTDNAVWMMLTGMAVCAFAYLEMRRELLLIGGAAATALALTGAAVPWFRTNDLLPARRQYHTLIDALMGYNDIGTILVVIVMLAVVVVVAGLGLDVVASVVRKRVVMPFALWRGVAALVGAAAAVAVTAGMTSTRGNTFGGGFTTLDQRFGFLLAGLCVSGLVLLGGERMVASRTFGLGVVAFAVGGLFPLIFNQSDGFINWGASFAAIYILLSLGLNVVVGFAGLLDLGYAAFFAIGAYTAASMNSPRHGVFLPFWVVLFAGAAVAALFGALLGAPTLRLRGDYLAIVTLGFGEIIPDLARNNFLGETGGPNGISGIHSPSIGHYSFGLDVKPFYWTLIILVVLVMVALRNLERSRLGRAWMAIREDEVAASATGINTVSTKLLAFSIGATVSGLAGAFYGAILGVVTPEDFDFAVSVTALSTVVLGGIGNNTGAAVGGLVVSFIIFWILPHLQEWAMTFGHTTGITSLSTVDYSNYKYIIYGVILILVMLLRPGGLLPSTARKVELQTGGESESLAAVQGVA